MGIMSRIVRIWKADVNGVMDELEDKGLLLKQSLRDMEEELERKHSRLAALLQARERAQAERQKYEQEQRDLEKDLEITLRKNKDDIARMLIKKISFVVKCHTALERQLAATSHDIEQLQEILHDQRLRYEELALKARGYFAQQQREHWSERSESGMGGWSASEEPSAEEIELQLLKYKEAFAKTAGEPQS